MEMKTDNPPLSRRRLFKKGAAAAASAALASQSTATLGQGLAVVTARTFRAWISRGTGRGRTTLQDLRLRPITGRQVVVRTEACNLCYSNVGAVLGIQPTPPATGAATPGRRSSLRVRYPAVRRVLSLPARTRGRVPVARP